MNRATRYDTERLTEAQFEPGSRGRVLKNLLGIRSKREIDALEAALINVQATASSSQKIRPTYG